MFWTARTWMIWPVPPRDCISHLPSSTAFCAHSHWYYKEKSGKGSRTNLMECIRGVRNNDANKRAWTAEIRVPYPQFSTTYSLQYYCRLLLFPFVLPSPSHRTVLPFLIMAVYRPEASWETPVSVDGHDSSEVRFSCITKLLFSQLLDNHKTEALHRKQGRIFGRLQIFIYTITCSTISQHTDGCSDSLQHMNDSFTSLSVRIRKISFPSRTWKWRWKHARGMRMRLSNFEVLYFCFRIKWSRNMQCIALESHCECWGSGLSDCANLSC